MTLAYARTHLQANGDYGTDIINTGGPEWTASYWRLQGVASTGRPPRFIAYRGNMLVVGAYSRVLIRYSQNRKIVIAGLKKPSAISVAKGSGSGGSSGRALLFCTFLHKEQGRILAESDRSNIVQLDGMVGEGFVWTIPSTGAETRVTHIRGYRSMDGSDYRLAWEKAYGATSVTENVTTGNLLQVGPDQGANDLPPIGVFFATEFAGSVWYARTSDHPYRIWRSKIGFPEYVHAVDYRDTDGRETITAIARTAGEEILVMTADASYIMRLTGTQTQTEWKLERLDGSVGCICEAGIREIHRKLWVPGKSGYAVYDGSFRNVMTDVRPLWAEDYKANPLAYGMGFAIDDRQAKLLYFFTPRLTPTTYEGHVCGTLVWVAAYEDFEPALGGTRAQPDWMIDVYSERAASALYNEAGEVVIGWCDGQIRKQDEEDGDDDGDALAKPGLVRHGHNFFNMPGDDIQSGKTLAQFWAYVESETSGWSIYALGGDEQAYRQLLPDNVRHHWKADVLASLQEATESRSGITRTMRALPKTVHYFGKVERASGRGFTFELRTLSATHWAYRGHGGLLGPGAADRRTEFETNFDLTLQWRIKGSATWLAMPIAITLAEAVPPYTPVTIELQTTAAYAFGPSTTPLLLDIDFTGAHMPVDVTDAAMAALVKVTEHIFTEPATGTVNVSAVDAHLIASNSRDAEAITVVGA